MERTTESKSSRQSQNVKATKYRPARSREIHKSFQRCIIEIDWRDYCLVHRKVGEGIQVIEDMPVRLSAQALQGTLED